jgi:DNA-binding MarR family transcriptional regulator
MAAQDLRSLLDRIRSIRHACDLDLLLFFYRHPCALLTSERIVAHLGYEHEQVAKSLEGLIAGGLLTRSQNPAHAARLYTLQLGGASGSLLSSLLKIASTHQGRLQIKQLLKSAPTEAPSAGLPAPRPLTNPA